MNGVVKNKGNSGGGVKIRVYKMILSLSCLVTLSYSLSHSISCVITNEIRCSSYG